jgi:RNA polymerase sigma-70 factor (ECF subfamily)
MNISTTGIDKSEFAQIFDSWYEPIRNFLYYKSKDIDLAEDIAQDVFLKLWEKRDEIKTESVKSYLYTIANNMLINRYEHQKVSMKFTSNYTQVETSVSPEYELEVKEFDRRLQNALNELEEDKRTVFLMNRIDGMTYVQIADSIGISVKAIEKRMEKALAFMRKRISKNI